MEEQLEQAVALVREVLGDELAGLYLFGSAVLGGLTPTSDIDLLAVTRRPTSGDERRRLVERLLALSKRPRYLELTVVVESDLRPWRYPPRMDLQYGDWLRAELERGEIPPPAPSPDLAVLITMALRDGRALLGPPPAEVFAPVPDADLLRAGLDELDGIVAELDGDTRNMLLTLARVWCTAETGEIRSKDGAADWALPHLPAVHRPVLERARDGYRSGDYGSWSDLDVRACGDYLAEQIRGSRRRRGACAPR
ncbi:MAG: aminoglycoside adenylyltransferase family protein [Gaiellaceae bacterium]